MNFTQAGKCCLEYHQVNSKKNTVRSYETIISKFCQEFGQRDIDDITTDEVLSFLNRLTKGRRQQTKKTRYSHLSSFFNFIKSNFEEKFDNPCDVPMMKKLFKAQKITHWDIIEKETVDEVIFQTMKPRNRLILELMARGGMRIGEVLKLTLSDIHDQKLILRDPKSGKEYEYGGIPLRCPPSHCFFDVI